MKIHSVANHICRWMKRVLLLPVLGLLLGLSACAVAPSSSRDTAAVDAELTAQRQALLAYSQARFDLMDGRVDEAIAELQRALQFDDQTPYLYAALASIYLDRGQTSQARELLHQALTLDPGHLTSELMLADVYYADGQTDQAIAAFRQVIERHPDLEDVYLHISRLYAGKSAYGDAQDILQQWLERHPESVNGLLELAHIYRVQGDDDLAAATYRQVIAVDPRDRQIYVKFGQVLEQQHQFDEALTLYDEAARQTEEWSYFDHLGATLLLQLERYPEALQRINAILLRDPADVEALGTRGYIYIQQQRWPEAEQTFRQALPYQPVSSQLFYWLAYALEHQQRYAEALRYYQMVEQPRVLRLEALVRSSVAYIQLQQLDKAADMLEQVLDEDDHDVRVFLELAALYQHQSQYRLALEVLQRGLRLHDDEELYYSEGVIYQILGETQDSIRAMREVLTRKPHHVGALNHLAYLYAEAGENLDEALEMAKAAARFSTRAAVLDTLGWVYYQKGMYSTALDPLRQAAEQDPQDPLILEHLGDTYRQLSQNDLARQTYEQILEMHPDQPGVAKKLAEVSP